MKVWKKLKVVVLTMLFCIGVMVQPALAATMVQDGIEATLTTDKENYQQGEEITVTLMVTNTNRTEATNVSLETFLPDHFVVAENNETAKQVTSLRAGETITLQTVCMVKDSDTKKDDTKDDNTKKDDPSGENKGNGDKEDQNNLSGTGGDKNQPSNGNNPGGTLTKNNGSSQQKKDSSGSLKSEKLHSAPNMGDSTQILLWVALLALTGIVVFVAWKQRKKKNKILAFFLCLTMAGSTIAGVFPEQTKAAPQSVNVGQTMELSTQIQVGGKTTEIKAQIGYTYVKQDTPADDAQGYTRGEWIQMLAEKIEMNLDTDPAAINHYFADTEGNEHEVAIETAQAYGILPPADVEDLEQDIPFFFPEEPATREFAAYTAVHAMGYDGRHEYDTSSWADWASIRYQNEAAIAVGKGFLELRDGSKFQPQKKLSREDADSIFNTIEEIRHEDTEINEEEHDNTQYADGVLKKELENITDYTVIENEDGTYTVTVPRVDATEQIKEGSVIVLPPSESYPAGIALKTAALNREEIEIILTCVKPELWEVVTKIDFVGGGKALIDEEALAASYEIATQANITASGRIDVGYQKEKEFKIGPNEECDVKVDFEIPDISYVTDIDVGINDIRVNEFKIAVTEKASADAQAEKEFADSGQVELGRVPFLLGSTGLAFDIVIFCSYKANGSAQITYKLESTQGYQYKDGTGRCIFNFKHGFDTVDVKGNAEGGIGVKGLLTLYSVFDLVGYYADLGVGIDGEFTYHSLQEGSLLCTDIKVYPYSTNGIDTDSIFGEVLEKRFNKKVEFQPLQNNEDNPFRLHYHNENGKRVSKCTYATGGITGYIYSSQTHLPIENARVKIYKGSAVNTGTSGGSVSGGGSGGGGRDAWSLNPDANENIVVFDASEDSHGGNSIGFGDNETAPVKVLYTDPFGKYSAENLQDGMYYIVASATSYKTYTINEIEIKDSAIVYAEDIYMVERKGSENGSVEGTITDAVTGQGIDGTSYIVRDGWNNKTGDAVTAGVFEDADYALSLNNGNYTLEISKEGYITNYKNITIAEDQVDQANITLVPENGADVTADQLRVVLTWGEEPADLDSHMICYSETMPYHIWYRQQNFYGDSTANLDVDDTDSYGPETVTVNNMNVNEKFSYYVHDYTNSDDYNTNAMSLSGAKVEVYLGEKNIATYFVPSNQEGTLWHVFDFDAATQTITPVNTFSYENTPSVIGGLKEDVEDMNSLETYAAKPDHSKKRQDKVAVEEEPSEIQEASETIITPEVTQIPEKEPKTKETENGAELPENEGIIPEDAFEAEKSTTEYSDAASTTEMEEAAD